MEWCLSEWEFDHKHRTCEGIVNYMLISWESFIHDSMFIGENIYLYIEMSIAYVKT